MPGLLQSHRIQHAGIKQHGDSATEFEYYINRVTEGKARNMGSCGYHFGTKESQPLLTKGRMNRVLIYPGAFNPPHRGHMLVLQHGFREAGEGFNTVAAIVLMKDDSYLEHKNAGSNRELLLTEDERGSLWRTDVHFPDWAWTLTEEQYYSAGDLQKQLIRLAKLDGFDLEFVMLIGPDNFSYDDDFERDEYYCDKVLISTAARAPENYSPLSGPPKISNCTIWSPVTPRREKTTPKAHSPSWLYSDEPTPLTTTQPSTTHIWECHAHGDPELVARYLYTPPALADVSATEFVSATAIHSAIKTTTKAESGAYIDQFALGPVYLKQQLARRDDGSHQVQQNLRAAEAKLKHLAFEDITAGKVKDCNCGDHCSWICDYNRTHIAFSRSEAQKNRQKEADAAFPFCLESEKSGERYALPEKQNSVPAGKQQARTKMTESEGGNSEEEQKVEDDEMAFEDTMRLRVPIKKEKILVHGPEYSNANHWLAA